MGVSISQFFFSCRCIRDEDFCTPELVPCLWGGEGRGHEGSADADCGTSFELLLWHYLVSLTFENSRLPTMETASHH
jgi:hypothetical protein